MSYSAPSLRGDWYFEACLISDTYAEEKRIKNAYHERIYVILVEIWGELSKLEVGQFQAELADLYSVIPKVRALVQSSYDQVKKLIAVFLN